MDKGLLTQWIEERVKRQRKLYNSGEMKDERRVQFEELLEMTERVKRKNKWG